MFIFTNKRLILLDKQGGHWLKNRDDQYCLFKKLLSLVKKVQVNFDLDAELKIWVGSDPTPISKDFKSGDNINDVYRIISQYAL